MSSKFFLTICVLLLALFTSRTFGQSTCVRDQLCTEDTAAGILSVTTNGENRVLTSSGCPGYTSDSPLSGAALTTCFVQSFPLNPTIQDSVYGIGVGSCVGGPIGIAVNGAAFFGPCDAENRDAYIFEGDTFDSCGGHWNPPGMYHYHVAPKMDGICIPGFKDTIGVAHSPLLGFMIDGVPIYGPYGDSGGQPTLDECGGHTDNTHNFYHYHTPYNRTSYPYIVNCLKGCVTVRGVAQPCTPSATQYDYSSLTSFTGSLLTPNLECMKKCRRTFRNCRDNGVNINKCNRRRANCEAAC